MKSIEVVNVETLAGSGPSKIVLCCGKKFHVSCSYSVFPITVKQRCCECGKAVRIKFVFSQRIRKKLL